MGLIEQLTLAVTIVLGAALWMEAAAAMREAQAAITRSGQRLDYADAALKEIQREASALKRLQKGKAGLRQAEARLSEATTFLLSKKEYAKETVTA